MNEESPQKISRTLVFSVSPRSIVGGTLLGAFVSAFLMYLSHYTLGVSILIWTVAVSALLASTDRIAFDGKRISRSGLMFRIWQRLNHSRSSLKVHHIEHVETHAVRMIKRGEKVFYNYHTVIAGRGLEFVISSRGRDFMPMVQAILSRVPEDALDNRSIELRDYLTEPKEAMLKARFSEIPPADVLENAMKAFKFESKKPAESGHDELESEKADHLRQLANELRLAGSLLQALEAFRRALRLRPKDGWILFEFARCMHSFASTEKDTSLERKAASLMRLSERRAGNDEQLLARLGENYFQIGEWRRAGIVFQRALESFRGVRGMAEIALREGKLAHVVHNFAAANRLARTPALKRWMDREIEYFSRLNESDEYMEMELSRLSLFDSLSSVKSSALRLAFLGFPVIAGGIVIGDTMIANIGWAVSGISLFVWAVASIMRRMMADRIPFELLEED